MKFMTSAATLAAILCALVTVSVRAADGPAHQPPEACQADMSTLCPGLTPGDHKLAACLREHRKQLSDGCKQAIRAMRRDRRPPLGGAASGADN